jgi:hypothetical protein
MRPLGFYTSAMPQDGSYLDEMQEKYGSTFADMPRTLKAALLMKVAENLLATEVQITGSMVSQGELADLHTISTEVYRRVTIREQLGLAEAIVNQLKQRRA